ncbi:MAG TPA: AAA family ATPase [Firmicutes bacterium]|nr:AAA family ATPase [Bacillota bacterium]
MRIKTLKAGSFGCLKNWEAGGLDADLIVVYGNNESGKSTLFNLIETLFYGWKPVTDNPYLPWDGSRAVIEGEFADSSGSRLLVQRTLHNRPEGRLIKEETAVNIGNKPLDILAFISREIFAAVYSLTLDKLCFPDESAWQELQDRLLGGQYAPFLRPVAKVINELENEAQKLWRPDRRGKPQARELQTKISELRQRKKAALENEGKLHSIEEELAALRGRLQKLQSEKTKINTYLIRAERLWPVKKKLERIKDLQNTAGDMEKYHNLPENPGEFLHNIEVRIQEIKGEIDEAKKQQQESEQIIAAFTEEDRLVCSQAAEIERISRWYAQIESDREQFSAMENELRRSSDRIADQAANFLPGGWKPELEKVLLSIEEVELRSGINSCKAVQQRYMEQQARLEGLRARSGEADLRILPFVSFFAVLLGIAGSLLLGNSPFGFAAALLTVLGLGLAAYWFINRGKGLTGVELKEAEKALSGLKNELQERRETVKKALQRLPVPQERLEFPDETILLDIKNIKNLIEQKSDLENKRAQIAGRLQRREVEINGIMEALGIPPAGDILECLGILEERLKAANKRSISAANALQKQTEIKASLAALQAELGKPESERHDLIDSLQPLAGESIEEKINDLLQRRGCLNRAKTLREDLEREYPDLAEIEQEINKLAAEEEAWIFSDHELAKAKEEREDLENELRDLTEKIRELETDLKHLSNQDRLDDITGEINELAEELNAVCVKRDRLELLKTLLKAADHRFREEHQPDVLQKAGSYLSLITGERYNRLYAKDDASGLLVRADYADELLEAAPPLSRGVLEQIYLALRLALVEHLDSGRERLPLLLDEVLVNWDGTRLEEGIKILNNLAGQRQVFLFTCHKWLAEKLLADCDRPVLLKVGG